MGEEKREQLGDQESGDWGSGPCSASNLCDFELLASLFWGLISPTSKMRVCTGQFLWAEQFIVFCTIRMQISIFL